MILKNQMFSSYFCIFQMTCFCWTMVSKSNIIFWLYALLIQFIHFFLLPFKFSYVFIYSWRSPYFILHPTFTIFAIFLRLWYVERINFSCNYPFFPHIDHILLDLLLFVLLILFILKFIFSCNLIEIPVTYHISANKLLFLPLAILSCHLKWFVEPQSFHPTTEFSSSLNFVGHRTSATKIQNW